MLSKFEGEFTIFSGFIGYICGENKLFLYMSNKAFYLLFLLVAMFQSCQEGWNGVYSDDKITLNIPQKPTLSRESMGNLLGEIEFEVLQCEYKKYSELEFKVYQGEFPEISEDNVDKLTHYSETEEGLIFRKSNEVDDLENMYLCSFAIVLENLKDMELYGVDNIFYKGHSGKSYLFVKSKTDEMHRIDMYIIEDKLIFLSARGKLAMGDMQLLQDFFDKLEVHNVKEIVREADEQEQHEIPEEILDSLSTPNLDYLMSAQHPYKPRYNANVLLTDYGYATNVLEASIPAAVDDPNRMYVHGVIDFQYDITELDTFDLDSFYSNYAINYSIRLKSSILDTGFAVMGGMSGYEILQKSRTGNEYYLTRIVLNKKYLFIGQVLSNKNHFTNPQTRRFFRSIRIRKDVPEYY